MQVSSFNARAALRVRVLPKHLTKRLQHVAAVDSAHGQNGQRVSNAPEPAVVLSELQDVKQQMSQLLQLLMVQQQQNSGLQQKVELLSQQVIMLKEEAGASSASRLPEQHQSLVSTSEKVATRPSSVPDGGDLASKPQVSSPSLAPSPMTKSTSSQAERSSPNYHGLVASDSAMVESKENVNAQNQAVEDEFSNRLDVQLDLMDVLMMVEPEGESDEELRYEAVQEEEEGTAAVLDVNEGVARLEEILSSQTSQGLIRRSPHHDAAPAEMAPEPTPHRASAHVDEGNTVSEQVNVDVQSGKGTALHMVSPAPVLPVSKLVSPAPVLPVSKLAEDPLLQELKHQNEQLVALLKNQGITPPESLIIQSRVPTVNKIKAPEVPEREIEATTAAITDGNADLLGKKYENKVDTTTAGATAAATAAAAAASESSDDPLPSTTVIDPKPAATEPTRVIPTTAADLKGAVTTATAVMTSTQESKLQLHRPLTLPQRSEKSSEQPSSKIVQTTSSQISATAPETELPSMRSAEINLDVVPSQSSALSQPENSLLMVSNLPVTLKKRDQSSEAQTLNADTSVRRDTDRRPETSNRPLSVPQTAVQRRISVAKKWQDIRAIVERQPAGFDALAAAAALNKLSELYPEGLQFINDSASSRRRGSESVEAGRVLEAELAASEAAEQLTTELMSLLQLQLPRLPANYLAEALGAAGKLGASAPRSAWLLSAMGAVQSKMSRMASSELVSSLTGLCALEAHPSDAWMRAVLGETQRRMTGQELSLSQLGRVAAAVAGLESKVRPDPEWLKIMEDSARRALSVQSEEQSIDTSGSDANTQGQTLKRLSSTSSTPQAEVRIKSQQQEELVGVISLLSGCQALGLKLDPEWALSVLYSAVSKAAASSTFSSTSDADRDLMQGCSPAELAGLAAALCDMKAEPSGDLLEGYAQAVWPKLQHLTSHQVMTVFDALVFWSYSFSSAMVASFSARLSEPEAVDSMKAGDMVLLLSRLSGLGGPADSLSIDAIQDALLDKGIGQAKSNHRLPPDSLVGILGALAALEASPRVPLLAAITRDLRSQLPSFAPSMFRDFARHCATLSVRVDIDLVESYFEVMLEQLLIATSSSQSAGLSKGSLACVELVCALGLIPSNKPRASLLGPLLGITQEVLPGLPPSQLSALLGAFASLKLTREDTQGVRPTINAGMPVPPTPEDFTASLVTALHLHLPTLPPAQMSVIGVRLASLPTPPPSTWAAAFLTSFQGKLEQAASSAVVQLLAALPGLAPDQSLVPEGWVQACLEKLLSGMESMDLDDMSGVLEAVAASGQNPGPQFLASIARQAQIRLDAVCEAEKKLSAGTKESVIIVNLGEFARLACGMAAVGAAPSSAWLQSLQRATLPRLSYSEVQSQPPSATLLADLSWAVAKLASNSTTNSGSAIHSQQTASSNVTGHSVLAPRFSLAPGFMDKEWMDQLLWCINYRVMSPRGDPFQLQDLAKVLWASAVIGLEPRREVINSFVGKSQDRLSSMSQTLTLHSLWSLSRHRAFMNSKWLNQWSLPVLNVVHTMGPQTYVECVWSLGLQHPEGTPEPSQHLLKQMGACLIRHLQASAVVYPGTGAAEGHAGVPGAAPLVPEQHISSHQLVQVLVVLARLGVGEYAQGLAAASCTALKASELSGEELVETMVALALLRQTPPLSWVTQATALLQTKAETLPPAAAARCLWALAQLGHHPGPALVQSCCTAMTVKAAPVSKLLVSEPVHAIDASSGSEAATVPDKREELDVMDAGIMQQEVSSLLQEVETALELPQRTNIRSVATKIVRGSKQVSGSRVGSVNKVQKEGELDAGLGLPVLVDAIWGLSILGAEVKREWMVDLFERLNGKVMQLEASQVSRLLLTLSTLTSPPPPALALELGKSAAARFASPTIPPEELADLIWAFARLDVKLPPAFASSAQRRLQLAMSQLPPPQLARMMWSLSSAGYQPTEPQLRAYAQKVQVALPSMCLVDLTASVEAFDKWDYKLPETMLSDVMEVSFKLMIQPQQGEEVGAAVKEAVARAVASTEEELVGKDATAVESSTTEGLLAADGGAANVLEPRSTVNIVPQRLEAQGLVQLVRSLLSVGGTPSQDWLYAWSGLLNAEAVQSLRMAGHVSVLQLLDLLALERFEKVKPSVRWVGAFLEALPPVSELEGKYVRCLCQVAARWKSQLLQAKQDNASVLTDLAALPRRVAEKLPAFNSQEAAGLIRDLATLQPDLFSLEESLIEALSDHAEASLCILSPGQQVELVVALSALLFTESNALMEGVSTSSTAKKGPGSKKLSQLYKMLLEGFDAWSFQQVDKEQLLFITELLVSACRRDKRAESQDRLKRASQAVGAAFLGKLKAVNGKDVSRFLMAFSQLPSQLPKNKVGIKYDPILELCLEGIASRMLTGSLRGPEEVSHVAYAVASTGVVPTKQWIADAMRAAQRPPAGSSSSSTLSLEDQQQGLSTEIAKADGASVARLCYAVSAWGADPGKTAAAWLLEAAAAAAAAGSLTPKDAALILLGASQLGVQGLLGSLGSGHVTKEWLQKFSEQALLPLMPRMASRAIATVSTALPAVVGVLSNREEILSSLEQAAGRRLDREEISIQDLEQVAMGLFGAKHRPQKMWLQTALRYAESKPAGAKAKVWLQDLAKL